MGRKTQLACGLLTVFLVITLAAVAPGTLAQTRDDDRRTKNIEDAQDNLKQGQSVLDERISDANTRLKEADKRIDDLKKEQEQTAKEVAEGRKVFQAAGAIYHFLVWFIPSAFFGMLSACTAFWKWAWPWMLGTRCGRYLKIKARRKWRETKKLFGAICAAPAGIDKLHECFERRNREEDQRSLLVENKLNLAAHLIEQNLSVATERMDAKLLEVTVKIHEILQGDSQVSTKNIDQKVDAIAAVTIDTNEAVHRVEANL